MAGWGAIVIALAIGAVGVVRHCWRQGRRSGMSAGTLLGWGVVSGVVLAGVHQVLTGVVPAGVIKVRSHPGTDGFLEVSYGPNLAMLVLMVIAVTAVRGFCASRRLLPAA
ncbi:hypothetical protein [Streptomyces sp. SAS_270]|uniref:hypothetical protein n=1 Tax=Streptomyces sp. SAS_270 TaxID=3412748 RepID=UPI00403CB5B6